MTEIDANMQMNPISLINDLESVELPVSQYVIESLLQLVHNTLGPAQKNQILLHWIELFVFFQAEKVKPAWSVSSYKKKPPIFKINDIIFF